MRASQAGTILGKPDQRILRIGPQDGPQTALLDCPFEDVFMGGGRGGGKTFGLILDFAYFEKQYGVHARGIIFRRSYKELEEVIGKGKEVLLPMGARYHGGAETFYWPSGAFLRMRHLDRDSDAEKYQGHSYSFQAFDELQNWPSPKPIDKLWATLRGAANVPKLRRSTGNPGGLGQQWVYDRYIKTGPWNVQKIESALLKQYGIDSPPIRRVWIPALLDDNKILMENDPQYEARLAESGGPKLFRAWRFGDWTAIEGAYFDFDQIVGGRHVYRETELKIPEWSPRWVSMDWGFDHPAAILWHAYIAEAMTFVTYRERVVREQDSEGLADIIVRTTKMHGEVLDKIVFSFDAFARKQDEQTIAKRMNAVLMANDFPAGVEGVRKRVQGWRFMDDLLRQNRWKIAEGCEKLREVIAVVAHDPDNTEDCLKVPGDDTIDSARYGLMSRPGPMRAKSLDRFLEERVLLRRDDGTPTDPIQREIDMKKALRDFLSED